MIESAHYTSKQITYSSKDSFRYAAEIHRPSGELDTVIQWCKNALSHSDWKWQLVDSSTNVRPGRYIFYFNDDQDFCAFKLKWT